MLLCIVSLCLSAVCASCADSTSPPSQDQVSRWFSSPPGLQVSNTTPVRLVGGENAFLCSAMFPDEGRNSIFGAVLVVPKTEKVVRLHEVGYNFQVVDIDNDGISEIITEVTGSGQGITMGSKYLLHLTEDMVIVLRKQQIMDNSGCCEIAGCRDVCKATDVTWDSTKIPGEGPDLSETVVEKVGKNIFTNKRFFTITNGQLLEVNQNTPSNQ